MPKTSFHAILFSTSVSPMLSLHLSVPCICCPSHLSSSNVIFILCVSVGKKFSSLFYFPQCFLHNFMAAVSSLVILHVAQPFSFGSFHKLCPLNCTYHIPLCITILPIPSMWLYLCSHFSSNRRCLLPIS